MSVVRMKETTIAYAEAAQTSRRPRCKFSWDLDVPLLKGDSWIQLLKQYVWRNNCIFQYEDTFDNAS